MTGSLLTLSGGVLFLLHQMFMGWLLREFYRMRLMRDRISADDSIGGLNLEDR